MHGYSLAFNRHSVGLATAANNLNSPALPLGQDISEAFPVDNHPQQRQHRLAVAPAQLQTTRILISNNTFLVALNGKGNKTTCGYSIQSISITYLMGFAN
ncbi:hypothetical protein ES705_47285 [subsurface metagenome]